ncbi:MAG: hypothetical protein ACXWXA_03865 [Candidatus Limnocylindrales bacterium]
MRTRWIIAGVLAAVGLVFIGQGTSFLTGSGGMYGDGRWAIVGLLMVVLGAAIGWSAFRNRRQA